MREKGQGKREERRLSFMVSLLGSRQGLFKGTIMTHSLSFPLEEEEEEEVRSFLWGLPSTSTVGHRESLQTAKSLFLKR